jgi:hypothetical protein
VLPSPNTTTSISASSVLDLEHIANRIHNSAIAVLHRFENGDANPNFQFIRSTARRLDQFVYALSDGGPIDCRPSKRSVMVDMPNDLLADLQRLPFHLRAVTTEESTKVDLGHLDAEDRHYVYAMHEDLNPGRFENARQQRRESLIESTGWQERIDTIIRLAQARPEPIKQLDSLADLTAEIIDTAAVCLDYGNKGTDSYSLRAAAYKQAIFDECRRKPYAASPKLIAKCTESIEGLRQLAISGIERIRSEQGDVQANASNLNVALERCQQFSTVLAELTKPRTLG